MIAAAIHDGNFVREELRPLLAISDDDRRREEDPQTGLWTQIAATQIVGLRSRFEVDLNRPRDKAVYLTPQDAWGLRVWKSPPLAEIVEASLAGYDRFYAMAKNLLRRKLRQYPRVVVYDLHTYNHCRGGPQAEPDSPDVNPEVNLGTGTMDRRRWAAVVDRFLDDLGRFDFLGRRLDVRENVKFFGGNFGRIMHQRFPESVCVLSIEFKKFFMDEWTGQVDAVQSEAIRAALASTVTGVTSVLQCP